MRIQRSAGVIVARRDEDTRYLLVLSALTKRPLWEFPKGAIEEGETEREAALRELEEEAGLAPSDIELVDDFRETENYVFTRGSGASRSLVRKSVVYYLALWRSGEVRISHEALDYRWADAAEAAELVRYAEKRKLLRRAEERLGRAL